MKMNFYGIDLHGLTPAISEDGTYAVIDIPNALITISPRPFYCDRGRYQFWIDGKINQTKIDIDWADGFPRYFFSLQRAIDEIHEWIEFNKKMYPEKFTIE
jgi:hypothetical protein